MRLSIDRAVKINLKLLCTSFCTLRKARRTNNHASLRAYILKKTSALFNVFDIDRDLIVFAIKHDADFVLADLIFDKHVNLPLSPGLPC